MLLSRHTTPATVVTHLAATARPEAIRELAHAAGVSESAFAPGRPAPTATVIDSGVAVSRVQCLDPDATPRIALGLSHDGLDFDALNGAPVRVLFLAVTPVSETTLDATYFSILSAIFQLIVVDGFESTLLAAASPEAVIDALRSIEERAHRDPAPDASADPCISAGAAGR